jgi:hypothetical protein
MRSAKPRPRVYPLVQTALILAILAGIGEAGRNWQADNANVTQAYWEKLITNKLGGKERQVVLSSPFSIRDEYDRAVTVTDAIADNPGNTEDEKRIWPIEAEIAAAKNARLRQIIAKAQSSGKPTEFVENLINDNRNRLQVILAGADGIPDKHREEYTKILGELSLMYRAKVLIAKSEIPMPIQPKPYTITELLRKIP